MIIIWIIKSTIWKNIHYKTITVLFITSLQPTIILAQTSTSSNYTIEPYTTTWNISQAYCESLGGNLPSIYNIDDSELGIADSNNGWTQYHSDSLYHWYVLLFFTIMFLNI